MPLRLARTLFVTIVTAATVISGSIFASASAAFSDNPAFAWYPASGTVYTIAVEGDVVYIGGSFPALRNPSTGQRVERARLAALDADTGALLPWNPGANDTVRALDVGPDGTVYAGGDFSTAAGVSASRLAAISPAGTPVAGWQASATATVRQIRAEGTDVYVAGNFVRINNIPRVGVAKLNASDGSLVTGWNANVGDGRVRGLALGPTSLVIGGSFLSLSGQPRQFLGSVSRATGAVTSWTPTPVCDTCAVLDLDPVGNDVLGAVAGGGGGRGARWSGTTGSRQWIRGADGDVQAVAMGPDGVAYFGGHFGPLFFGEPRHQLVAIDADNGSLLPYDLETTGNDHPGIWDIAAEADQLHIGGGTRMAASSQARYLRFPTL